MKPALVTRAVVIMPRWAMTGAVQHSSWMKVQLQGQSGVLSKMSSDWGGTGPVIVVLEGNGRGCVGWLGMAAIGGGEVMGCETFQLTAIGSLLEGRRSRLNAIRRLPQMAVIGSPASRVGGSGPSGGR